VDRDEAACLQRAGGIDRLFRCHHRGQEEVATAQAQGELDRDPHPRQFAFQLNAYVMAGNWANQLFADPSALTASRAAVERLLPEP
jgi:Tetracyclin repressor-like, C-terminal domain